MKINPGFILDKALEWFNYLMSFVIVLVIVTFIYGIYKIKDYGRRLEQIESSRLGHTNWYNVTNLNTK